jgi:hypothetical protein
VKTIECIREDDVLDALTSERWPDRVSDDLRQHVSSCQVCGDLIAVIRPILADSAVPGPEPRIPSSAVMWWRAQMRARQEAAREAARPITVAQAIAAVSVVVLVAALATMAAPWIWSFVPGLGNGVSLGMTRADIQNAVLARGWVLPALMVGVWLLLAPLAIYFAVTTDD